MGLIYAPGGPNCFVSPDVQELPSRERDIPYEGTCVAVVLATTDREREYFGMIFDSVTTLVVEALRTPAHIEAFRATCASNRVAVHNLAAPGGGICPPPPNQTQHPEYRRRLFDLYRPKD